VDSRELLMPEVGLSQLFSTPGIWSYGDFTMDVPANSEVWIEVVGPGVRYAVMRTLLPPVETVQS
jgi:hypothetical protein